MTDQPAASAGLEQESGRTASGPVQANPLFRRIISRLRGGRVIAALFYLVSAVIATAWILLQPGTLGHHWDWIIPASPEELRKLATTNLYAWQDFALGSFVSYRYTTTLLSMLLGGAGFLGLSGAFVSKSLVVGALAGSAFAMYTLVRMVLGEFQSDVSEHRYALVAGALYGFSPFAYNQIIAGDQLELISYMLAPLVLLFVLRATAADNPHRFLAVVAAGAITAILSAAPQTAAITVGVAFCLVVVAKRPWKTSVLGLTAFLVVSVLLCAYWILPVAFGGRAVMEGVATTPEQLADASFREMGSLFQSLTTAAEPGAFYFRALPGPLYWAFVGGWLAVWVVVVSALSRRRRRITIALLALYVGGALLPLGGAPVIGPIILAAFNSAQPASLLFRTAQHLEFLPTLVIGPLAAVAAAQLGILERVRYRVIAAACLVAISSAFVTHSNYLGLVGPFQANASEEAAVHFTAGRGDNGRLLFVPTSEGYYYHPGIFDYFFEGGDDGSVRFSPMPTLAPGFKWSQYHNGQLFLKALDELMPQADRQSEQRLLASLASVHFVEARADLTPSGGVLVGGFDYDGALRNFDRLPFLRPVMRDDRTALWSVERPVNRIYTPDCTIGVDPAADPYDLLAWSDEVSRCSAPAFIVAPTTDDVLVHAWDFRPPYVDVGTIMRFAHQAKRLRLVPSAGASNAIVEEVPDGSVTADPQNHPYYVVQCRISGQPFWDGTSDNDRPHLLLRIKVPQSGSYLMSLLAPDWNSRFDVRVPLLRGTQLVKFDLKQLGSTGSATVSAIAQLRIANVDPRLVYFGTLEVGPAYVYQAGEDAPYSEAKPLFNPAFGKDKAFEGDWWGSNASVSFTADGGASFDAPTPYFVFESDLTSTGVLSSPSNEQLRIYMTVETPIAGRYLMSFLAPDWNHRFDALVALPVGQSSTSYAPMLLTRIGDPRVSDIRRLRIANVTAFPRSGRIGIRPPVAYRVPKPQEGGTAETAAQPTWNRWDGYYFGSLQKRLALRNTLAYRVRGLSAAFVVPWGARYRIYLHLQTGAKYGPFAVSVDEGAPSCIDSRLPVDRTEDVLLVAASTLTAGRHNIHVDPCPGIAAVGDLAIVSFDIVPDVPVTPVQNASEIADIKESPGAFMVTMRGSRATYLVFNDSYDPRWVATQRGRVIDHLHANGYANGWLVEHPGDGPIELSFTPQVFLNAGYLVSALSFVGLMGFAVVPMLRRRFTQ